MSELKLKQLQHESEGWKRLLCFMLDENIHLKNRLSEILKSNLDKTSLDDVENFHNNFLKEDQIIRLLRNEVAEFDKLLIREESEDGIIKKKINSNLKRLRNNIKTAEKQFGKLRTDFSSYILEYS